ncbi:toxic anion resistance protein [Oceanobacter mangrovi]|uniref:toxic anion resistance protein n=1 Tax=Oceanobacter mangrovi TaxID=2862510 RepID=UPI001C8F0932|nr:toxic anion resistance protein [Oceanobacter mangrovi]
MTNPVEHASPGLELKPVTLTQLKQEKLPQLNASRDQRAASVESEYERQADQFVASLLAIDGRNEAAQRQAVATVETLGADAQQQLNRHSSAMLKAPAHLISEADDGGPVAKNLLQLQERVAEVNPNKFNLSESGFRKLLSLIPGFGTPLARWYAKYQTVEAVLKDIVQNMEAGKQQLVNDNTTLMNDQSVMRQLTYQLEDYITLGQLAEKKLSAAVSAMTTDDQQKGFLQDKVLFPINQRIMDLQQQLAVNQQGYLSIDVIVENNKQLIRGVERALNVTITALGVAATLAIALKRQQKVLDATNELNSTTSDMLLSTSEQLRTQGVEIQKQASSANLDINKIKAAFANVEQAIADLSSFRKQALTPMRESIEDMNQLSERMEEAIRKVEQGRAAEQEQGLLIIDATDPA